MKNIKTNTEKKDLLKQRSTRFKTQVLEIQVKMKKRRDINEIVLFYLNILLAPSRSRQSK
jgi:hypothetical protein